MTISFSVGISAAVLLGVSRTRVGRGMLRRDVCGSASYWTLWLRLVGDSLCLELTELVYISGSLETRRTDDGT
jgi:hypothetical protein